MKKIIKELNIGFCGICEKQIWSLKTGKLEPNKDYREFWMIFSNDTIAKHAICDLCYSSLDNRKVKYVFKRIVETWLKEMVGWANDKQFLETRKLKVLSWGLTEQQAYDNKIKYAA